MVHLNRLKLQRAGPQGPGRENVEKSSAACRQVLALDGAKIR